MILFCAGRFASLEAVQPVSGGHRGIGDGMTEVGMIALCGGHPLPDLLRALAPVAALAGCVVLGILYLLRGAAMERAVMTRANRRQRTVMHGDRRRAMPRSGLSAAEAAVPVVP